MLRDVFYYGNKPNVHPREKFAASLEDARQQCTTEHFWIINEFCDYQGFDWDFDYEFLPNEDVWAEEHNNVWPSQHQKDSGTWLCPSNYSEVIIYRADVEPIKRKSIRNKNWVLLDLIDEIKFDFSWHPDPTDPPYIYKWGCKYFPVELQACLEYHVPNATNVKYMYSIVELLPQLERWKEIQPVDKTRFDLSWRPSPLDPPMNYVWGNKYIDGTLRSTLEYHMPNATEIKYMPDLLPILPEWDKWVEVQAVDKTKFDFTWRPDPREPAYIYTWGNKYIDGELIPTLEYYCEDAIERKYMSNDVCVLPEFNKWVIPSNIDDSSFDYTWRPDPREPDFIYQFGTQWQKTGGPRYVVDGATEIKYVDIQKAKRLPNKNNFNILDNNVIADFDYSWHHDETDEPYIYVFGNNQYSAEVMPTIEYIPINAIKLASGKPIGQLKYVTDIVATLGENKTNWIIPDNVDTTGFDFSWVPNPHDGGYIYQFGTQWQKTGGPKYIVKGATKVKYVDTMKVKKLPNKNNFEILDNNVIDDFDYSWHPDNTDEPYIYVFGNTQYPAEVMPTIQYIPENAVNLPSSKPISRTIKYINDVVAKLGTNKNNWIIPKNIDIIDFDLSWVPNPKDPPYIYEYATQWNDRGGIKYIVPGATEYKYLDIVSKTVKDLTNWIIPDRVDTTDFDFSWVPHPNAPPYVYQFGTQWQKTGGPRYVVDGATEIKYVDIQKVKKLPNKNNWEIADNVVIGEFDYSWHHDETDEPYIYVFGNTQYPAEVMLTIQYVPNNAVRLASGKAIGQIKYVNDIVATLSPTKTNWEIPNNVDVTEFDFSWVPNPKDPEYIYQFGTQWQKTGGPKYVVNGATEIKYVNTQTAKRLPNKDNFTIIDDLIIDEFDYSWHHDETDEPYIYVFGNTQYPAEVMPTVQYIPENAVRLPSGKPIGRVIKYVSNIVAKLGKTKKNWIIPEDIDSTEFDFSWIPDPNDEAFIYQFGTQWQKTGGPKYVVDSATEIKYIDTPISKILPNNKNNWEIPNNIKIDTFDFSWHPDDTSPPYIYQFGTQHQKTGGPRYIVKGATETQYVNIQKATILSDKTYWTNPNNSNITTFDFSWHPDANSPPYIYQFGTLLDKNDGPRYLSPNLLNEDVVYLERIETQNNIEIVEDESFPKYIITTSLEDLIKQHPNELFWALNPDLDYSEFDFDWRPDIEQSQYLHAFGSQDNINTQTYFVNSSSWLKGFKEINYVEDKTIDVKINIDMFFVDRSNSESQSRFENLKIKFPNIQKTRYLNSWVDTINRCINRASSNLCWILNSELDYSDFDFNYYPNPWQMKMVHVFGTQWSHWGTTFMVNRETFGQDTKYIKIIEHLSNLNFVKDRKAKATNVLYDVVYIDHGNMDMTTIKQQGKLIIKYQDSYIATFQKMLDMLPVKKEHYIWIASTICDYKEFDFTYICDPFAKEQLHVFPSDNQKFGDTFLIDVNKFRTLIEDMSVLEDYNKINFNQSLRAKRLPPPVIITEGDTHVASINTEFNFPYAVFKTTDNKDININDTEPMSLWTPESKNIQITSIGGTRIVVPKEAKDYVKHELYDYPYIITNSRLAKSNPLDIVFLSNGETGAEENYQHLLKVTEGLPNRVTRVEGVNGRVAAYHAAADASNTPWMFTVFAKLKVSNKFDWNWQPDRLQLPKHYVFYATNPVNGLKYGSMAMIAYNKKLTLANEGKGLDFTMDDEHEVLEINSGVANFNTDEWVTWRTAFREALKLRAENSETSINRLNIWLTVGMGKFNEYSTEGAQHAVEYFEEVNGDFDKLKLSYDWPWLKAKFNSLYD